MTGCDADDSLGENMKFLALAAAAATMCVGTAQAAVTVYTDFASFNAATTGATKYTFPGSAVDSSPKSYSQNGITFDLSKLEAGAFGSGVAGALDGNNYLATQGGSFTVSSMTNAFGLYIGSWIGKPTFGYSVNGTMGNVSVPGDITTRFIGFSGTGPLSVLFSLSGDDELDVASFVTASIPVVTSPVITPPTAAVPEPATWAMMILGFAVVGAAMRRRKTVVATSFHFA